MLRKFLLAWCCMAMLVLANGGSTAIAKQATPTFEKVFTPPVPESESVVLSGRPTQFGSAVYISTSGIPSGGQIWRSFDGVTWNPVTGLGFGINSNYQASWDTTVFQGKLYVPANCYGTPDCPGAILRSANGTDWETIFLDTQSYLVDKLGVFQGMIYATSVDWLTYTGGQIWRSSSGDPGSWEVVKQIETPLTSSSSPTQFSDRLYISGYYGGDSVIIWQSADGLNWETSQIKITNSTIDPNVDYLRDGMLTVFEDNLYLCVINTIDGGAIYRTQDGQNWEIVFQVTPGQLVVWGVEDLLEYEGDLYAATNNIDWETGIVAAQLWRSHSGDPGTWEQITNDADWQWVFPDRGALGIFKGVLYFQDSIGSLYRMDNN